MRLPIGKMKILPSDKTRTKSISIFIIIVLIAVAGYFLIEKYKPREETAVAEVTITGKGFDPSYIAIKAGTKVVWTNNEEKLHQLMSNPHPTGEDLPGFKSEILNSEQRYEYIFEKKGSFGYHDALNPTVNGTVNVE